MSELSVLVTGASGFVGRSVSKEFEQAGHRVTGTSTSGGGSLTALDMNRPGRIDEVLAEVRPRAIVHLAGIQSVPESWRDPDRAFRVNAGGTAALLRAIESSAPEAHLVLASTAAVYGEALAADRNNDGDGYPAPFVESDPIAPQSPYAASKAAAELLAGEAAARTGLPLTIVRLFNQFGPDQPPEQTPADFARQIAAAEAEGKSSVTLEVGNPDARRDYTDTRDTARALRLVVEGQVTGKFNLCSGKTRSLTRLIEGLAEASGVEVGIERSPQRTNRNDVPVFGGSATRLKAATGWSPRIPLDESLAGMLRIQRNHARG